MQLQMRKVLNYVCQIFTFDNNRFNIVNIPNECINNEVVVNPLLDMAKLIPRKNKTVQTIWLCANITKK